MLGRQIRLAREIAAYIDSSPKFELLSESGRRSAQEQGDGFERIYIIVLFRATDETLNRELVQRINSSRRIYVSGTQWDGQPAARFAVASWMVDVEKDLALVKKTLESVTA